MTTIVYSDREGVLAFDSRCAQGDLIMTDDYDKSVTVRDKKFVLCGSARDLERFAEEFKPDKVSEYKFESSGYMVQGGKCYSVWQNEDGIFRRELLKFNDAGGSGAHYALAALDFGKTAIEAVEYAKTRDCRTGGKVRTIHFKIRGT